MTLLHANFAILRGSNASPGERACLAHAKATESPERFLLGRQLLLTGFVFAVSELTVIGSDTSSCDCAKRAFGLPVEVCSFIESTGLGGSLIVLAFGQITPQLIAASHPVYHFGLPGVYELVSLALMVEYTGVLHLSWSGAYFARWYFKLNEHETFGVGGHAEVQPLLQDTRQDARQDDVVGVEHGELEDNLHQATTGSGRSSLGLVFRTGQYVVGVLVFGASLYLSLRQILVGGSDASWRRRVGGHSYLLIVALLVLLYLMGVLEGMMLAVLALEKAPAAAFTATAPCVVALQKQLVDGDVVRRFLLGRQCMVVVMDFLVERLTGVIGAVVVVVVSQALPQLISSRNPLFWVTVPGTLWIFHTALLVEATGLTHFGWLIANCFMLIGRHCGALREDHFSVGAQVVVKYNDEEVNDVED
eukprot:CAMPEP_0185760370 /NCGR_PEP_ID=MMETSP1174-20130828/19230_1 /TAXON_ID=35687 /ORGANISM="Dictyocha speculum, Strain CCMP1381" /LENGTH=418 /DNA_ID=CAMNT_0028441139 /DNA_START=276 /DNA_END=1535 /DNA_ORIENTATION=-